MAVDLGQATQVVGNDGRFSATLSDQWEIWGPNGGYLAAIALRAAGEMAQIRRPRSFYCHFLSSPAFAPVEIEVASLKRGSRAESLVGCDDPAGQADLAGFRQDGRGWPGTFPPASGHARRPTAGAGRPLRVRARARPSCVSLLGERGATTGPRREQDRSPVLREWTRFRPTACFEDPFVDAARSLILLDTFGFPAAYQRYRSWDYLAPNLDTSLWLHQFNPLM